jgi:hypothetical protein
MNTLKHPFVNRARFLAALLLAATPPALAPRGDAQAQVQEARAQVQEGALAEYLGEQVFATEQLWKGRGGTNIVTATDGTVIAFQSMKHDAIRRSIDGGRTWGAEIGMGAGAGYGNAVVDDVSGDVLYVNPRAGWVFRSRDHGATWVREAIESLEPDGFGCVPTSVSSMQPGITLAHGEHRGRLVMPARVQGPAASNDVAWRPYHYSSAVWSDDGGRAIRSPCSAPARAPSPNSPTGACSTTRAST